MLANRIIDYKWWNYNDGEGSCGADIHGVRCIVVNAGILGVVCPKDIAGVYSDSGHTVSGRSRDLSSRRSGNGMYTKRQLSLLRLILWGWPWSSQAFQARVLSLITNSYHGKSFFQVTKPWWHIYIMWQSEVRGMIPKGNSLCPLHFLPNESSAVGGNQLQFYFWRIASGFRRRAFHFTKSESALYISYNKLFTITA